MASGGKVTVSKACTTAGGKATVNKDSTGKGKTKVDMVNWVGCDKCGRWELFENCGLGDVYDKSKMDKVNFECRLCKIEDQVRLCSERVQKVEESVAELRGDRSGDVAKLSEVGDSLKKKIDVEGVQVLVDRIESCEKAHSELVVSLSGLSESPQPDDKLGGNSGEWITVVRKPRRSAQTFSEKYKSKSEKTVV